MSQHNGKYLALSGGVGGAKLAVGLARALSPEQLTIVANTADDFEHFGLHISPDLDSVMYALAGIEDARRGWGLKDETWSFMSAMDCLGGETWFRLGDRDMATHVMRSKALSTGQSLGEVTASLCQQLGIAHRLLPMSDDPVRTVVQTDEGLLPFQQYFVQRQCEPRVTGFRFEGIESARPQPDFLDNLGDDDLAGIIICPSNPFVSIDPVLQLQDVRTSINKSAAPVIAVSPIIGGQALKGPAAKMMTELDLPVNAATIADYYRDIIDIFVLDKHDDGLKRQIESSGTDVVITNTVMQSLNKKIFLAHQVIKALEEA